VNRQQREALRQFKKAGIEVEVVKDSKHITIYHDGEPVHALSQGSKVDPRAWADLRRKIRRIQQGQGSTRKHRYDPGAGST